MRAYHSPTKYFKLQVISSFILLININQVWSQSFQGLLTDNYSGINGVVINPASIVDSRYIMDINLVGASISFENDVYGIKSFSDIFNGNFNFQESLSFHPSTDNMFYSNIDALGPSFLLNINSKNAIAIFSRVRAIGNLSNFNGRDIDAVIDGFDLDRDFQIDQSGFTGSVNSWVELGASYARTLLGINGENKKHFLKMGVTIKYLKGIGYAFGRTDNLGVTYDADGTLLPDGSRTGSISSTGLVTYGYSNTEDNGNNSLDDFVFPSNSNGISGDIGFVYEWRPNIADHIIRNPEGNVIGFDKSQNKYKLKLGISLTDFGKINYKDVFIKQYDVTANLGENSFAEYDTPDEVLNSLYTEVNTMEGQKVGLPMALNVSLDWKIYKSLYLNANGHLSLTSKDTIEKSNTTYNQIALTPRFESKWYSIYAPIRMTQENDIQFGTGIRLGPLYVGSNSIISLLSDKENYSADVYMGVKIPIYQSRKKDQDFDGIKDRKDQCPNQVGPKDNHGCPWPLPIG